MSLGTLSILSLLLLSYVVLLSSAEQCGTQAGGALCPGGLCCSQYGWCGTTDDYCNPDKGCQSNCTGGGGDDDDDQGSGPELADLLTEEMFDTLLLHRNDAACPAGGFYTYDAFIEAAKSYPAFGRSGDNNATRLREIAAFLAQTSHETRGGEAASYTWGYCYNRERNPPIPYCESNPNYPCAPGQQYYGRGPIQLSWNYNYGQCGNAIGVDLLNNPDLVATDPIISFKTAFWFWMTKQPPKPSCHQVIIGKWSPSASDVAAGRVPGYGLTTNVINGGIECGKGWNAAVEDRIGFYKAYCDILGVSYGDNLDCYNQTPFGYGLLLDSI